VLTDGLILNGGSAIIVPVQPDAHFL